MRPLPCRHLEWGTATVRPDGETKRQYAGPHAAPFTFTCLFHTLVASDRAAVGPSSYRIIRYLIVCIGMVLVRYECTRLHE